MENKFLYQRDFKANLKISSCKQTFIYLITRQDLIYRNALTIGGIIKHLYDTR